MTAMTTGWKSPCPPLPLLELLFPVLMSQTWRAKHNYQLWHLQKWFWTNLNSDLRGRKLKGKCSSIPGISFGRARMKNKTNESQSQPCLCIKTVFKRRPKKSTALFGIGTNKNKAVFSSPVAKCLNSGACLGSMSSLVTYYLCKLGQIT